MYMNGYRNCMDVYISIGIADHRIRHMYEQVIQICTDIYQIQVQSVNTNSNYKYMSNNTMDVFYDTTNTNTNCNTNHANTNTNSTTTSGSSATTSVHPWIMQPHHVYTISPELEFKYQLTYVLLQYYTINYRFEHLLYTGQHNMKMYYELSLSMESKRQLEFNKSTENIMKLYSECGLTSVNMMQSVVYAEKLFSGSISQTTHAHEKPSRRIDLGEILCSRIKLAGNESLISTSSCPLPLGNHPSIQLADIQKHYVTQIIICLFNNNNANNNNNNANTNNNNNANNNNANNNNANNNNSSTVQSKHSANVPSRNGLIEHISIMYRDPSKSTAPITGDIYPRNSSHANNILQQLFLLRTTIEWIPVLVCLTSGGYIMIMDIPTGIGTGFGVGTGVSTEWTLKHALLQILTKYNIDIDEPALIPVEPITHKEYKSHYIQAVPESGHIKQGAKSISLQYSYANVSNICNELCEDIMNIYTKCDYNTILAQYTNTTTNTNTSNNSYMPLTYLLQKSIVKCIYNPKSTIPSACVFDIVETSSSNYNSIFSYLFSSTHTTQ